MSWCDKLASVPTVGFRMTPQLMTSDSFLASLVPILQREVSDDRATYNLEGGDAFSAIVNTEKGFRYSYGLNDVSVNFNHRLKFHPGNGGPPTMELLSHPAPYTDLLQAVTERMQELLFALPHARTRQIKRYGVVTTTTVDLDDAPPGVQDIFKQIGNPLGGTADYFNVSISVPIQDHDGTIDRCIHTYVKPEDDKELATIQLDFQRIFSSHRSISHGAVKDIVERCNDSALAYFDRVAEGGLSDASNG